MSPAVLGAVVGSLVSFLGVRLMTVRWRHRPQARWEDGVMLLQPPAIRRHMATVIIALFPVVVGIGTVRTVGPVYWPMLGLGAALFAGTAWLTWSVNSRVIAMGRDAIELRGIWGQRIAWSDIEKVEGFVLPKRSFVVFTGKDGKTIAVDSTLYGWEEFVEKAPELGRAAGKQLEEAVARVRGTP